jgi:predicted AlkP superfamily phosphohydrolase/phosphomutase
MRIPLFSSQRPRLVVLGLDGLPLSLARTLCGQGHLPNLARLALDERALGIDAELPELSPVNWTSFYTAAGPEEHGVFGFTSLDPHSYELRIADSTQVACPRVFDRLGERGLISKVVNLPNAYPAAPLKGMLVAGFVAPELSRAVFPPFLAGPLRAAGYKLEADTERGAKDPDFLLAELHATLAGRRAALDLLWPDLAWDLFVFVLTETDRLFHFLFPAMLDEEHALHRDCLALLVAWDRLIGELLERYERLPEPKRLLVLADHGFTTLRCELDLNVWLRREGLLQLGGIARHELDASVIADSAQAFALDPGRVYLHDGRFSRGRVAKSERGKLLERIQAGLLGLTYEGERVMERVYAGVELYPGAAERFGALVPDLICLARPGFDLKAKFDRQELFGHFGRRGAHTATDAFFYDSAGARPARVREVGGLILEHFGIENRAPSLLG